jgi:enoyl-CoA hydratase/carnithine racemase
MLFESAHVRATAEYGIGTLWLNFPGEPVNALDARRLTELDSALAVVERNPFLNALVVRSAKPAGFCAGLHPSVADVADRAAFARHGQRVLARLAALPFTTVAFIDGPCLGVGLELALVCDYLMCVASPATHLGFPGRFTCFGGSARLRTRLRRRADTFIGSGRTFSGREARDLGLVDRAFCARRAKIELRTFLDELERAPRVPDRTRDETGCAAERRAFAQVDLRGPGFRVCVPPSDSAILLARGFITPLEAEQMRARAVPADLPAVPAEEAAPVHRRAA